MFARYLGEEGAGLAPQEVYYINVSEELVQQERRLCIQVGDFWASDYKNLTEARKEWDFNTNLTVDPKYLITNRMSSLS